MSKIKLYQNENFDLLRNQEDPLADQAVNELISRPEILSQINQWSLIPSIFPQNYPQSIQDFFLEYTYELSEQEREILIKGQSFFNKQGDIYLAMLGFYSLPYCYAFANGAEVLVRSTRIVNESGKRLGETAKFLLEVFRPGAFLDSREAFFICAKIRLIHAFSRYFIHHYSKDWNPNFGKPINQEDMLGKNLAFSLLVLRGMRKIGLSISQQDSEQILGYWKILGKLMGIQTDYWPDTNKEAYELEKLIRQRHMRQSEAGEILIQSLLSYYEQNQKEPFLKGKSESLVSFMIGKEASKALGIQSDSVFTSEIIGAVFQFLGWKNYGEKKSHARFNREFEEAYFQQFGEKVRIQLPERKRS
ncbi:DUF2236 domain-containing protein [Algoriphagus aestuarii]|nr:DUF2236 domain-containing protein [Algoriphagus aestuarii]